jgi:hypothetical protein
MTTEGAPDVEAVIEVVELLRTDLTLFAAARSAAKIRELGIAAVIVIDDLFCDERGFLEMPDAEIDNLLAGIRVTLTLRGNITVITTETCRIIIRIVIHTEVWFFQAE